MLWEYTILIQSILMIGIYCEKNFRYAYVSFRHGARAPYSKTDILDTTWKSAGELTIVGQRMHYLGGLIDRERYDGFISKKYDSNEVVAFSTTFNRTKESMQARFQGLFNQDLKQTLEIKGDYNREEALPPIGNVNSQSESLRKKIQNLQNGSLPNFLQMPISNSLLSNHKYDYYFNTQMCPGSKNYLNGPESAAIAKVIMKKFLKNNGEMLKNVFKIELDGEDPSKYDELFQWCDVFTSNYYNNENFDKLKNAGYDDDKIKQIYKDVYEFNFDDMIKYRYGPANKNLMLRLEATPKFVEILRDMDLRIKLDNEGKTDLYSGYNSPKLKYFSAHDTTMTCLANSINLAFGTSLPDGESTIYATVTRVELIKENNDYIVEVWYNKSNIHRSLYSEFRQKIKDTIILSQDEINNFCFPQPPQKPSSEKSNTLKYITIALSSVAALLLIGSLWLAFTKKRFS